MGGRDLGKSTKQYAACRSSCLLCTKMLRMGVLGLGSRVWVFLGLDPGALLCTPSPISFGSIPGPQREVQAWPETPNTTY